MIRTFQIAARVTATIEVPEGLEEMPAWGLVSFGNFAGNGLLGSRPIRLARFLERWEQSRGLKVAGIWIKAEWIEGLILALEDAGIFGAADRRVFFASRRWAAAETEAQRARVDLEAARLELADQKKNPAPGDRDGGKPMGGGPFPIVGAPSHGAPVDATPGGES